ncbi:MAG: prolipoprotein diacylglyceryl transferase [Oscillospiraceae bacterium]|nr:prolipoprotein diacylglyceryl transferase [Oscillospiraceae bacterium]
MERIAFVSGGTYIYWSSIILTLAALTAIAAFAALYLRKSGNGLAICLMVPMSLVSSLALARLVHWYCRSDSYASLSAAMSDHSWGGYALMGVFGACILCACLLRLVRVVKNLPEMLDCMALAGGLGIVVGRLSSFYNSSDRGMLMPEDVGLPFAYPVTNAVSGVVENRLATFMLQAIVTAVIVAALAAYLVYAKKKNKQIKDGDICLLFLAAYGASQIVFDSTRYDSLFMRSNGFISIVQILGLVAMVLAIVLFSVRMVKNNGMKPYFVSIWVVLLAMLGVAGYMEYHVQRHGDQALFAYTIMSICILVAVALTVAIRYLAEPKDRKNA